MSTYNFNFNFDVALIEIQCLYLLSILICNVSLLPKYKCLQHKYNASLYRFLSTNESFLLLTSKYNVSQCSHQSIIFSFVHKNTMSFIMYIKTQCTMFSFLHNKIQCFSFVHIKIQCFPVVHVKIQCFSVFFSPQ